MYRWIVMLEHSFRVTQRRERPERPIRISPSIAQEVVFVVFLFVALVSGMTFSTPTPDQ